MRGFFIYHLLICCYNIINKKNGSPSLKLRRAKGGKVCENGRKKCPVCGSLLVFGIRENGKLDKTDIDEQFANLQCCSNPNCCYEEPFAVIPSVRDQATSTGNPELDPELI